MKKIIFIYCGLSIALWSCSNDDAKPDPVNDPVNKPPLINYAVLQTYPHDTTSFTEGFLFHKGQLYESTGATASLPQTRSLFGVVDLANGLIDKKVELDRQQYFGEGIVFLKNKVYQLTYQTRIGFVYDADTYRRLGQFSFPSAEGWGMTTDGKDLIMSDGTNRLTWLDPDSFHVVKTLAVTDANGAVDKLNELEYIGGSIYTNVYTTPTIVKIDTTSGQVTGQLDMSSLVNESRTRYTGSLEMNGIAYDSLSGKVYVTGKMWPVIYVIGFAK